MKQLKHTMCTPELSRLISAAVVSPAFCRLLLRDPATALENGYMGKPFNLSAKEQALVCSIQATALEDFVHQLVHGVTEGLTSFPAGADLEASLPVQTAERPAHTFVRQDTAADRLIEEEAYREASLPWNVPLELMAEPV